MKKFPVGGLVLLFFCGLALFSRKIISQTELPPPPGRKLCDLADVRLKESSGLVASRRFAGESLLWTHNDSGGEAAVYLVDLQGRTRGEAVLEGARNVDWEDIAFRDGWVYVADTGDNLHRRACITIYRWREADFKAGKATPPQTTTQSVPWQSMTLHYPDGARDCETLVALPNSRLLLVSKNGGVSSIFVTPQLFADGATQQLEPAGQYAFTGRDARGMLATGGDLSPDGRRLVIRTYTYAQEWDVPATGVLDWPAFWKQAPRVTELPPSPQGEAICYDTACSRWWLSSEGPPAMLFEAPLPAPFAPGPSKS